MIMRQNQTRKIRGFTLTEVAIVLGIVGLILGAVWVAAASVYDNMRVKRTNEAILQMSQAIRSLYASATTLGNASASEDLTTAMLAAGVVPRDLLNSAADNTVNPWNSANGGIQVFAGPAANSDEFVILFNDIPSKACINLLTSNGQQQGTGMSGYGSTSAASTSTFSSGVFVPVTVTAAQTLCGNVTSNTRDVALRFRLRT